jgi:hypothetical protein
VGSGEKDKRRAGYSKSGERWVERPEAKVFAKRERYKKRFITHPLFYHASSPKSVAQVIHAFRKSSKIQTEKSLKDGMRVEKMVRMQGGWTDEKVNKALSELAPLEGYPGIIMVGGPGNSVMLHGAGDSRGFTPERTVKVRKTGGSIRGMEVMYHMTEPKKITMGEKRQTVDRVVKVLKGSLELFPEAAVVYTTMFPRHVERCCDRDGHMSEEDVLMADGIRWDIDRDIKEMVMDMGKGVRGFDWWDLLGLDEDMSAKEVKRLRVIGQDGVHLTARANKVAAVSLCQRSRELMEEENAVEQELERSWKKRRS